MQTLSLALFWYRYLIVIMYFSISFFFNEIHTYITTKYLYLKRVWYDWEMIEDYLYFTSIFSFSYITYIGRFFYYRILGKRVDRLANRNTSTVSENTFCFVSRKKKIFVISIAVLSLNCNCSDLFKTRFLKTLYLICIRYIVQRIDNS